MRDGPYRFDEQPGPAPGTPHDVSAGDRARDHLSGERHAVSDARAVDPRDRELAQRAMSVEDPRAGSNLAHEINDPVFKAETLGAIAINATDPHIASDIAHYIDPTITDATGNPIHDTTLSQIATKPTDPRRGMDIAQGIQTPKIKAETFSAIAINATDPHIASDIAHRIDPTITDANGNSIRDITLARIA